MVVVVVAVVMVVVMVVVVVVALVVLGAVDVRGSVCLRACWWGVSGCAFARWCQSVCARQCVCVGL